MNKTIETFARKTLKVSVKQCTETQQHIFKRMYSHNNLDLTTNEIINNISTDKLDWALTQVEITLKKNIVKYLEPIKAQENKELAQENVGLNDGLGNLDCCEKTRNESFSSHCKTCGTPVVF